MRPVIFLDIDGVLHIAGCRPGTFDRECVDALNWLTDTANARIVVSSTWRHMRVDEGIAAILKREGVRAKVVGKTPDLHTTRGSEITAWLAGHAPRRFVILDDDRDMDSLHDHLVQTSWEEGLTVPLAELALRQLTSKTVKQ